MLDACIVFIVDVKSALALLQHNCSSLFNSSVLCYTNRYSNKSDRVVCITAACCFVFILLYT
jgi:hypothetical protein